MSWQALKNHIFGHFYLSQTENVPESGIRVLEVQWTNGFKAS